MAPHGFRNSSRRDATMLIMTEPDLESFFYDAGRDMPEGPPTEAAIQHGLKMMEKHGMKMVGPQ